MQSITSQGPEAAIGLGNSKDTADQSPFLVLPAEIRNKIYRYSLVEAQPGDRIRGFFQPPLTRVNRQIRLEALPMYYGQNRFLLSIPPITTKGDLNAWPDFNRMFRAFEAGSTGGRGTGSLRFIRDLQCAIIPTSADRFLVLDLCFLDFEGPKVAFDNTTCRNRWDRNAVFSGTGARAWHDWLSVYSFVGKYLNRLGVTDGRSVFRLIGIVIMIAKECPSATKEIHFHSDVRKRDGARGHPACVTAIAWNLSSPAASMISSELRPFK